MSTLNLVPNTKIMLVQLAVFLVNAYVIKKYLVEPYLKQKSKRDKNTSGAKCIADAALAECEVLLDKINLRIDTVKAEIDMVMQSKTSEAIEAHNKIVEDAKKLVLININKSRKDALSSFESERKNMKEYISDLVEDFNNKLIIS